MEVKCRSRHWGSGVSGENNQTWGELGEDLSMLLKGPSLRRI